MSCSTQHKHYDFYLLLLTVYVYILKRAMMREEFFFLNTIESGSLLFVEYSYEYTNNNLYDTFI